MHEKQKLIKSNVKSKKLTFNYHEAYTSFLEGVFARGDRKLCKVMLKACERGFHFDGWSECFDLQKWLDLFEECGIDPAFYANRRRSFDEVLPWDHLDYGIKKEFLINECKRAYESKTTPNCRQECSSCGAARFGGGICYEAR